MMKSQLRGIVLMDFSMDKISCAKCERFWKTIKYVYIYLTVNKDGTHFM